jgi:hypothetical protein
METRRPEKKLIAALGIVAGAGQEAPFPSFNGKSTVRRTSAKSAAAQDMQSPSEFWLGIARASFHKPDSPSGDVVIPLALDSGEGPSIQGAHAVLSITRRVGAAVLDAFIILFACSVFVGISQPFRMGVRIGQFDLIMLTCAGVLIAGFYALIFKLGGHGTAGQTWLKPRVDATAGTEGFRESAPR